MLKRILINRFLIFIEATSELLGKLGLIIRIQKLADYT